MKNKHFESIVADLSDEENPVWKAGQLVYKQQPRCTTCLNSSSEVVHWAIVVELGNLLANPRMYCGEHYGEAFWRTTERIIADVKRLIAERGGDVPTILGALCAEYGLTPVEAV